MKKMLSAMLLLAMLFTGSFAAAEQDAYQTNNFFYDNDSVQSIAYAGGVLYVLRGSGLYIVYPDGTQTAVAPADAADAQMYTILSDGQTLYGLVTGNKLGLKLLVDTDGSYVNQLLFETDAFPDIYPQNPVVKSGTLYFMYSDGQKTPIAAYTWQTGESTVTPLSGIRCFDVGDNGQIIALQRQTRGLDTSMSLITAAPGTELTTEWAALNTAEIINRMAYDDTTETAYLFTRSTLYVCREDGEMQALDQYIAGDVVETALLADAAALIVDNTLVIRSFAEDANTGKRRLTLLQRYGRGSEYRAFLTANPNVDLVFASAGSQTSEEKFIQDMLSQNAHVDVYILSDTNLLHQVKQKGYYVDMAQSPAIQSLVSQMYAPLQSALTADGTIVAFPQQVFFDMLCYHKATFDALGILPPATYEQYFDFCLTWLDTYAEAYPDVYLNPFISGISMQTLLAAYADEQAKSGQTLTFSNDTLQRTLTKFMEVQAALSDQSTAQGGTPLFYTYDIPLLGDSNDYAYLPLAFAQGVQPVISPRPGDFRYFVINPYSANSSDALALAASIDIDSANRQRARLYESIDQPIENPDYQTWAVRLQEQKTELEASLAQADEADRKGIEEQLAALDNQIATNESFRWDVSESALAFYKAHADWLYINPYNPFTALLDSLGAGEQDFLTDVETTDIPSLLSELDRRVGMMLLEKGAE